MRYLVSFFLNFLFSISKRISFIIRILLQGFAELEYGMLQYMGAIDDTTPVVTSGKLCSVSGTKFMPFSS